MRVLLVIKTTNLELHGERVRSSVLKGVLRQQNLDRLKTSHDEHHATVDQLKTLLKQAGLAFDAIDRAEAWPKNNQYDAVISVGGDGTLLSASHQLPTGGLLMGIRSSTASVGYLCAGGPEKLKTLVTQLQSQQLPLLELQRLKAKIKELAKGISTETVPVINDFLYANANPASTTRYKITVSGKRETQKSSGVWVACPAGSTAAILSAGGERVAPDSEIFQYRVRELFTPSGAAFHLVGGRFDPDAKTLVIENRCEEAILALDGQHGEVRLSFGDTVTFQRASTLTLVRPESALPIG